MSLNKKVTKEVSIGEALTAKSIGTSSIYRLFYPDFEPICSSVIAPGNHTTANWLKVGLKTRDKTAAAKDFADNASPGRFLWFISCADTRNEHITGFGAESTDRKIPI